MVNLPVIVVLKFSWQILHVTSPIKFFISLKDVTEAIEYVVVDLHIAFIPKTSNKQYTSCRNNPNESYTSSR